MCIHMYVLGSAHSPADERDYIFLFFMLAASCPDPKSHIGQPVAFEETDEEEYDDEQVPDHEWQWNVGITITTVLKKSL